MQPTPVLTTRFPRSPNLIHLAVLAVGGRQEAANLLGVSPWSISAWQRSGRMPAQYIRRLCEAGGVISVDQLLAFLESRATAEEVAA